MAHGRRIRSAARARHPRSMKNLLRRLTFNSTYLFGTPPWDSGITPPELYDFIASHPAGRAIDIGCGTGTNVITLANAGWQVTGFDFASRAVGMAQRKIKEANLTATVFWDDATQMRNVRGQFDLALDIGCFHGIENKTDYLTHLTRILAPGGFWLMYGFFKPQPLQTGPGLADSDLELIQSQNLTLTSRKDGFDRRELPSAWFLWQAGS
ncbi:MAG TPA: hypothetical protein DCY14_08230 [Anaerolineae bacterium]|nr:hypothetical protein [Anaerolineae bacterium]